MPALHLDMTIPLGDAGTVHLSINVDDISALTPQQRSVLAETGREFYAFAAATLDPIGSPDADELREQLDEPPPATVHDPNGSVLAGITGTRRNTT